MQIRKRHRRWPALVVMLMLWLSSSLAFAQPQPPGPVVKYQFRTAGQPQPARFNLVHNLLHFDPGAATPFHQHPGQVRGHGAGGREHVQSERRRENL